MPAAGTLFHAVRGHQLSYKTFNPQPILPARWVNGSSELVSVANLKPTPQGRSPCPLLGTRIRMAQRPGLEPNRTKQGKTKTQTKPNNSNNNKNQ